MVAGGLLYLVIAGAFIYVQYTERMEWHERPGDPYGIWIGLAIFVLVLDCGGSDWFASI